MEASPASEAGLTKVIEHPVFFDMSGLSDKHDEEKEILQGLYDLQFHKFSDLHFLYTGQVYENSGIRFTHALVSRFPSLEAMAKYYELAIMDIAKKMWPRWLKNEFCVDYEAWLPNEEVVLNPKGLIFYVIFIKVKVNTSPMDIEAVIQSFLGLAKQLDYVTQLTAGENLYLREYYRTCSHAFTAYLPSVEALEKFQKEAAVLSVLEDMIRPMSETFSSVALVPYSPDSASL